MQNKSINSDIFSSWILSITAISEISKPSLQLSLTGIPIIGIISVK